MLAWTIRRLLQAAVAALVAFLLVFSFLRFIPGDPVDLMLGEQAMPAQRERLRANLGLDQPFPVQLWQDVTGLVTEGDLGQSLVYRKPVAALIGDRVGPTAVLALAAMAVAVAIALPLGIAGGWRPRSRADRWGRVMAVVGVSIPNFWLGPLLLLCFAVWLEWLPLGGYASAASLVLPAITLGTALAAMITRMTRSGLADMRQQTFVAAAYAKGASDRRVLFAHALKPSLIPVITIVGLQTGALLSGAVITETIFRWPGIGRLLIEAVQARDYPVVQGVVITLTGVYVLVNTLVDLGYALLDPRVRLGGADEGV